MKHFQQTQIVKIVAKTMHKKIPVEDKIGIVIGTNTFCEQTYDGKLFLCIKSKDFYYILVLFIFPFDIWDKLWVLIQPVPEVSLLNLIYSSDMWQFTKIAHADNVYCPAGTRLTY